MGGSTTEWGEYKRVDWGLQAAHTKGTCKAHMQRVLRARTHETHRKGTYQSTQPASRAALRARHSCGRTSGSCRRSVLSYSCSRRRHRYMAVTWPLHDSYMAVTWYSHGSHMDVTCALVTCYSRPRCRSSSNVLRIIEHSVDPARLVATILTSPPHHLDHLTASHPGS